MIERGGIYWADLGVPVGSRPAKRRPVLVISADIYNASRLATVLVAVITSNTALATMPGTVFLPARRPACAGTAPPSRSDEVDGASITWGTCRRHRPSRGIPRGPDIAPLPIG